jgi:hypothetical protein
MPQTLVTDERYRALTGDLTSSQATVLANLERAVRKAAGVLNRPDGGLQSAARVDTGYEYAGVVAPVCTPVTVGPVVAPIAGSDAFDDAWIFAGWANPNIQRRRKVTITYTGGWTAYDGAVPLPQDIEDAIVAATQALCFPVAVVAGLALTGAHSANVGDVNVAYDKPLPAPGQIPAGTFDGILKYRYRGLGAV